MRRDDGPIILFPIDQPSLPAPDQDPTADRFKVGQLFRSDPSDADRITLPTLVPDEFPEILDHGVGGSETDVVHEDPDGRRLVHPMQGEETLLQQPRRPSVESNDGGGGRIVLIDLHRDHRQILQSH